MRVDVGLWSIVKREREGSFAFVRLFPVTKNQLFEDCLYHHSTTMALVTIVGFPCCGKSTRAKQIKEYLEKRIQEETTEGPKLSVVLVDDDNSHVPRSTYDSEHSL